MKKILLLLYVLLLSCQLPAQEHSTPKDTIILRRFFHNIGQGFKNMNHRAKTVAYNAKAKYHDAPRATNAFDIRFSLSLNAGGNYYADFGPKHFPMHIGGFIFNEAPYASFTRIHDFSFHGGLLCAFQITKHFSVEGGLMYFSRRSKDIFSSDTNEINTIEYLMNFLYVNYTYEKEVVRNNQSIEVPFYFGYTHKRFSALIGVRLNLFSVYHFRTTLIDNSVKTSNIISHPFKRGSQAIENSIPSLKFRYLINRKKIPVSVYCSADWLYARNWDFLTGIQVGIFSR